MLIFLATLSITNTLWLFSVIQPYTLKHITCVKPCTFKLFIQCLQSKHLQHLLEAQQMEVFPSNPSSRHHHTSIHLFLAVHLCCSSWLLSAVGLCVYVYVCVVCKWLLFVDLVTKCQELSLKQNTCALGFTHSWDV